MRKKTRKKTWRTLLGFLLCIFTMTVCVWADEGTSQNPDYVTDYYMVVESPEEELISIQRQILRAQS